MAKLIVNPTTPQRRELLLPRTLLSIGRDPSNDLVLADAMVSRRHAVIELRGTQFFLRDCASSNGSLVNGDRVSERGLRDGDLVAIGTARLLFREDLEALDSAGKVVLHPSAPRQRCAKCGTDYRRGDVFCKQCGATVQAAQPKTICTACGTAVLLPARFCNACGGALAELDAAAVDSGTPPPEVTSVSSLPTDLDGVPVAAGAPEAVAPSAAAEPAPDASAPASSPAGPDGPARQAEGAELPLRAPASEPPAAVTVEPERELVPPRVRARPGPGGSAAAISDARARQAPRPMRVTPPAVRVQPVRTQREAADAGSRLLGGVLDLLVVGLAQALLMLPAASFWWSRELNGQLPLTTIGLTLALVLFTLALGALYFIYFWGVRGATPGKQLVGLAVEGPDGELPIGLPRAAARFLGYLLSAALLGGGFLLIVLDGSGLHDRLAATRVVRRRP